jgi:hypothetical protein
MKMISKEGCGLEISGGLRESSLAAELPRTSGSELVPESPHHWLHQPDREEVLTEAHFSTRMMPQGHPELG